MNKILEEKYSYLTNFFKTALSNDKNGIANSIIFYGSDILAQYYLAMSIAKDLNCSECRTDSCKCINCSWIYENQHPAVLTISKVDNKPDNSKTVISKEQIDLVKDSLVNSSEYHRVFIFCDAQYKQLTEFEKQHIDEYREVGIKLPHSESESLNWYPSGITKLILQDVAANALLKSIEEPPPNVTFIFLTKDKDDLIQTIVSRSQAFYVPGYQKECCDTQFLEDWFKSYPEFDKENALKFSGFLYDYQTENDLSIDEILNIIQYFIKNLITANLNNKQFVQKAMLDIEKIQQYKKMSESYIKEQTIYEELAFYFAGNL